MLRHYPWKLCAGIAAAIALLAMPVILLRQSALPVIDWQTADDAPDQTHACAPQKQELSNGLTGHVIPLDIYLPPPESDTDIVLILLHGFQSRKEDQQDNALALCTAGYRVIVPTIYHHPLTPNVEERVADVSYILDVLAEQNSELHAAVLKNTNKLTVGIAGHSAGGGTALALAAQDTRIAALVGLDAVLSAPGADNPEHIKQMLSQIAAPSLLLRAAPHSCNAESNNGLNVYENLGAPIKADILLSKTTHCDYLDASISCGLLCGSSTEANRSQVTGLMRAWFDLALSNDTASLDVLTAQPTLVSRGI